LIGVAAGCNCCLELYHQVQTAAEQWYSCPSAGARSWPLPFNLTSFSLKIVAIGNKNTLGSVKTQ